MMLCLLGIGKLLTLWALSIFWYNYQTSHFHNMDMEVKIQYSIDFHISSTVHYIHLCTFLSDNMCWVSQITVHNTVYQKEDVEVSHHSQLPNLSQEDLTWNLNVKQLFGLNSDRHQIVATTRTVAPISQWAITLLYTLFAIWSALLYPCMQMFAHFSMGVNVLTLSMLVESCWFSSNNITVLHVIALYILVVLFCISYSCAINTHNVFV